MLALLPVISLAMASATGGSAVETVSVPRTAQARLAEVLGSADAIESITANDRAITFGLESRGESLRVVATVDPHGRVRALSITDLGAAAAERGPFTWLASALIGATAITDLEVDLDGHIRLTTDDAQVFLVIPGHESSATNMSVEARWAAVWDAR